MEKIIDTFEKGFLMPYPVVHVLFFLFCVGIVAVYAITGPLYRRELCFSDARKLLLLAFVGGACTLFPDIMVVYNIFINNTLEHCSIGSIPTHSLLFSFTAILFGGGLSDTVHSGSSAKQFIWQSLQSLLFLHICS